MHSASSVDPSEIVSKREAAILKFNSLAEKFSKLGWISCEEVDDAKEQ